MKIKACVLISLISTALALSGCGGGDDDPGNPSADVTGTWAVSITTDAGPSASGSMTLGQNGSSVQGTLAGDRVAGSMSGNQLALTDVATDGFTVDITATVSGNTMTGTWVAHNGSKGTLSAAKK